MTSAGSFGRERDVAREVALEAAGIVLGRYDRGFEVEWKGESDPVTEADRAANELILERLRQRFPGDAILSEESRDDLARLEAERVWIVDPLDGTMDFVDHTGEFAVMVGLVVQGEPVVGAVCQPLGMRVFHASRGGGAVVEAPREGPRALRVTRVRDPSAMRLVVTRSHRYAQIDDIVRVLGITREHALGSVGLKVGALASGDADIYAHYAPGTKEWDTCAPGLILAEAGGVMTDAFGRPLAYNRPDVRRTKGVLASNGTVHDRLVELLAPIARAAGLEP
jgi:3'(2'), 5'-bisphosphate nucleotidase